MDTLIGQTLSHYRIERELGRGGMGVVYLARDMRLNRPAAIKALPEDVASDRDRLARFKQEAQVLASLSHPNIAAIYGLEESDGSRYLALEYVEGETLAQRIARGPLPIAEVVEICLQVASGMEAAHDGGVIHRDLKPGNVMITRDDRVKVVDFGLAKVTRPAGSERASEDSQTLTVSPETMPGTVLGTAAYLSPEQACGKPVDRRTDIWSFGCTLYECLTGKCLFSGATAAETIAAILERDPDWSALPAKTPTALRQLLQRCLERDPKRRLRDIGDARLALEDLKAGHVPAQSATSPAVAALGDPLLSAETPSIAVLPFADMSPGKDQEYFSDGLSEELINVLAKIRGLRVVSRTSAFFFRGKDVDLATVAEKLNVTMVLEGSVRKAGNRLRITAQLIQVGTDSHLWSQTYDRDLDDIFAVQDNIAQSVVGELRGALMGERPGLSASAAVTAEVSAAVRGRGEDPEAHRRYLQGRFFHGRMAQADVAKAIEYYGQALALEPGYALAWAWLSNALACQASKGWAPAGEGYGLAREAAERAIQLEPDLAEGHAALGAVRLWWDWDWKAASSSTRRALELAPGNAEVIRLASDLASDLGQPEEAVTLARRAVALDPLSVPARRRLGAVCLSADLLNEAEAEWRKSLEIAPQQWEAHWFLGLVHLARGRLDEAMRELEQEPAEDFRLLGLTMVHHAKGQTEESDVALRGLIAKYAEGSAVQIAEAFAFRGEPDLAFEWLERAYKQRDAGLAQIRHSPRLRNLHSDPRWGAFLKKMGHEI